MLSVSPHKLPCTIAARRTQVAVLTLEDVQKTPVKVIARGLRSILGVQPQRG